ncbi:hypothetical protein RaK2_00336 [Klebsiella phage vB_KleM_RaK2]|uniref:Phage protein n=1 Tax=Klebsiella phage vB_KleM_RaK2 TaxID=1147094 RepID=H6X4E3_9CAUD|nr:hypothetical protein F403_gp199 [Klebsiella phage vB_KleM_RaK2]AFA44609.1 hypothetical protein RaK2_00336 [Klebsiella phage vB_KleM_RaK2]
METVIATTKINGLDNEVSLIHDGNEYVVSYGIYKTYHDAINEAFEDYMKAIEIAYDDYR